MSNNVKCSPYGRMKLESGRGCWQVMSGFRVGATGALLFVSSCSSIQPHQWSAQVGAWVCAGTQGCVDPVESLALSLTQIETGQDPDVFALTQNGALCSSSGSGAMSCNAMHVIVHCLPVHIMPCGRCLLRLVAF